MTPGKKPASAMPSQKAHEVEAALAADQRHRRGDQPPADHDARDPDARAESLEREIARDLEQDVADKEDAGPGAEDGRREAEIRVHGERGEADIHSVEEVHHIAEAEKGKEAARGLGNSRFSRLILFHRVPRPPADVARSRWETRQARAAAALIGGILRPAI
jgi:hypothetical protein